MYNSYTDWVMSIVAKSNIIKNAFYQVFVVDTSQLIIIFDVTFCYCSNIHNVRYVVKLDELIPSGPLINVNIKCYYINIFLQLLSNLMVISNVPFKKQHRVFQVILSLNVIRTLEHEKEFLIFSGQHRYVTQYRS